MKRYWRLILLLVFVGVVGGGAWYYYRDYPVFTEAQDFESYPVVSWQRVVDGSVVRSLARQAKQGKLTGLGDDVVPVINIARLPAEYVENNGLDLVELPNEIVRSPMYNEISKRPFVTVTYYQTMIGEERYYLIYQRWRSVDGSESYVRLILPEKKVIENEGLTQYYKNLTALDASHMLSPIMRLSASSFCIINVRCQTICTTVAPSADSSFTRQWITAK